MSYVYERVYLIGVDGAGAFFTKTGTPRIDDIFSGGAYNHKTLTAIPTISAECWGSMLHGVTPALHRFMNGNIGDSPLPGDYKYPSVFKTVREHYPDAVLASVSCWNTINVSLLEDGIGIIKETGSDEEICEKACRIIRENDPKFLFVQLDSVDAAGHKYGYGKDGHLKQITFADALIGRIFDAAKQCGHIDSTLFLVTADHGGTPFHDHGGATDAEKYVSFFARGKSVVPGNFGEMEIRDTPAVVAFALGIDRDENWSARLPGGLFADGETQERKSEALPGGKKRYSDRKNTPTRGNFADYADMSALKCRFAFDGSAADLTGNFTPAVNGRIYYPEGFTGQGARFDDCVLTMPPVNFGSGFFTIGMFVKLQAEPKDKKLTLFSTKNVLDAFSPGIEIYVSDGKMGVLIGTGDGKIGCESPLPLNYDGNWFHFMCSLDRNCDELCFYYDFNLDTDYYEFDTRPGRNSPADGEKTEIGCFSPAELDELIIFGRKLSDGEIESLMRYYEQ